MKEHNEHAQKQEIQIHIDHEPYQSPNPTTGAALYQLGHVPHHYELFREVESNHEDEMIPDDDTRIHLKEDEHFYTQKEYHIIVNAREKIVTQRELSFNDLVNLAFDTLPTGPNIMFTIVYRKGHAQNPAGTLLEGQSIKIKKGMIFNVTSTDKS